MGIRKRGTRELTEKGERVRKDVKREGRDEQQITLYGHTPLTQSLTDAHMSLLNTTHKTGRK